MLHADLEPSRRTLSESNLLGSFPCAFSAQRYGSAAGGGAGVAGLNNSIITQHAFGRTACPELVEGQAARPLEPVLGRPTTNTLPFANHMLSRVVRKEP